MLGKSETPSKDKEIEIKIYPTDDIFFGEEEAGDEEYIIKPDLTQIGYRPVELHLGKCRSHIPKQKATCLAAVKRSQRKELKEKIRLALPILTPEEVRRHRIPYHEAKYYDLREAGYTGSAEYFKALILHNRSVRKAAGPNSTIWNKPTLEDKPKFMDFLADGLRSAEHGRRQGSILTESSEFLQLAIIFMKKTDNWWWLADQLFLTAIEVATEYRADGSRKEAVARYAYAIFLLNQLRELKEASVQLHRVRELSIGKKWTPYPELDASENLFRQSCNLLYSTMLTLSRRSRKTDPVKAAQYCAIAIKRAIEADKNEGIAETLLEQGLCYMSTGDYLSALNNFKETLKRSIAAENIMSICEAHLNLSITYSKLKDFPKSEKHLLTLLKVAETHNYPYQIAKAYRALGEYYLQTIAEYKKAEMALLKSVQMFYEQNKLTDLTEARCLAAIASGHQIMRPFFNCILKSAMPEDNQEHLIKLIRWKERREPFWSESELDNEQIEEIEEEEQESSLSEESLSKRESSVSSQVIVHDVYLETEGEVEEDVIKNEVY